MKKRSPTTRVPGAGVPCERCGVASELRKHLTVLEKHLRQPFYYSQWYCCMNPACPRQTFMLEEDKILNRNDRASYYRNMEELNAQTSFFQSL